MDEDGGACLPPVSLEERRLWDYGTEVTDLLKKLTGILKDRFGGIGMADKYRIEVRNIRRKPGEPLRSLYCGHSPVNRLSFPQPGSVPPRDHCL